MHYCEHCDRPFKSVQGLLGHNRFKHNANNGQHSSDYRPNNEPELLEQLQWQLNRLEELEGASSIIDQLKAAAIEEHKHGMSDPECPGCITIVRNSLADAEQKGVDRTVAFYEAIPGIKNLREHWQEKKRIDPDGDQNWTPDVIAAVARGEGLITITGGGVDEDRLITITGIRDEAELAQAIIRAVRAETKGVGLG